MAYKQYLCIDLKSFFASVECVERGLNPMTDHLVVADMTRSNKTICLAVTPAMKALGVKNRCRVFEIPKDIPYIAAPPRMQLYIQYAAEIYGIYLTYIAAEDMHVYSIDEVFLDVTNYLSLYKMSAPALAKTLMNAVYEKLGLRAACGVGTNLYLAKIALDITAKHSADFIGVLDEDSYKEKLWKHRPLTDFWRIGTATARRLERLGLFTMQDIATTDENLLYQLFGVDAELLIDHAHGKETTTIADIKAYKAETHSLSSGQILMRGYSFSEGLLIVKEMMDLLCLDMVEKGVVTRAVTLMIGYQDAANIPSVKGTASLSTEANAATIWLPALEALYRKIVDPAHPVRRVNLICNHITPEGAVQFSMFTDTERLMRERKLQSAVLHMKHKYGKNAVLKGINLEKSATTMERNQQIGGHRSGE